jgi:hypothetical protein
LASLSESAETWSASRSFKCASLCSCCARSRARRASRSSSNDACLLHTDDGIGSNVVREGKGRERHPYRDREREDRGRARTTGHLLLDDGFLLFELLLQHAHARLRGADLHLHD